MLRPRDGWIPEKKTESYPALLTFYSSIIASHSFYASFRLAFLNDYDETNGDSVLARKEKKIARKTLSTAGFEKVVKGKAASEKEGKRYRKE